MNNRIRLLLISILLVLSLIIPYTIVSAEETKDDKLPEELCTKIGKFDLDNVLDPNSMNYDPNQRYGPEGSRFGPPDNYNDYVHTLINEGERSGVQYYYGTYIYPNEDVEGVWARQKISTSLNLENSGDSLFAPTLLAPNYCRLESLASYVHNGSSTERYWKIFDHYNDCFIWATAMNANFTSRYSNSGYVSTWIDKTGEDHWWVYIYDWTDSEWDLCTSAYGDGDHSYGWDAWECYDLYDDYPDLPEIRSYYLRAYDDGDWEYVSSSYGVDTYLLPVDFPYDYDMNSNYYDWYVGP